MTTATLTAPAYTLSDASDAVLDFEAMIGCTVRKAHVVVDRLASIGATFDRFEVGEWKRQTFHGVRRSRRRPRRSRRAWHDRADQRLTLRAALRGPSSITTRSPP